MTTVDNRHVTEVLKFTGSVDAALAFCAKKLAEAHDRNLDMSIALWTPLADHFGAKAAKAAE